MNWISTRERLPEARTRCLYSDAVAVWSNLHGGGWHRARLIYDSNGRPELWEVSYTLFELREVSHWAPIAPPAPEGE
jgi:hypothetical protein